MLRALVELTETAIEVDFTALFRGCLNDEDADVRLLAIEGLWESEDVWLVGELVRFLKGDPHPGVRAAAAASLGRFVLLGELGDIEAAVAARAEQALLEAYFTSEEPLEVRRRALEAVAYSCEVGVGDLIEEAYYQGEEEMRLGALFAMGRSADRRWRSIVIEELESPSPAVRYEAALACGELELRDAVALLSHLISDADSEVWNAAVDALGKIGGAEARQILQSCCRSENEALQAAAEEALEQALWLSDGELDVLQAGIGHGSTRIRRIHTDTS
jgi:HEAT repeat protein